MYKSDEKYEVTIGIHGHLVYINGLPRSETSALTSLSAGSVSNIIKDWNETTKIHDIEDIRSFMKEVYKTGLTVKQCVQGFRFLEMANKFQNNENQAKGEKNFTFSFLSFIDDVYNPCIELGIPPSLIPGWIKDLRDFLSQPSRCNDKDKDTSLQFENKDNRLSNYRDNCGCDDSNCDCQIPIKPKSNTISFQKTRSINNNGPMVKLSDTPKQSVQPIYSKSVLTIDKKLPIKDSQISFISTLSSIINSKKEKCMRAGKQA